MSNFNTINNNNSFTSNSKRSRARSRKTVAFKKGTKHKDGAKFSVPNLTS